MPPLTSKRVESPRPGQNADGVKRKGPIAAQALAKPGMAGRLSPQLQPPAPSPFPQQMPGMPPEVQSFPHDMAALQHTMAQGFQPGSTDREHQMASHAMAIARAQENANVKDSFEQEDDAMKLQQLGALLQGLMMRRNMDIGEPPTGQQGEPGPTGALGAY